MADTKAELEEILNNCEHRRVRLEAEKAYQTLSKEYKKAFITSDKIQLPYNVFCDDVMPNDIFDEAYQFDNDTIYDNIYYED